MPPSPTPTSADLHADSAKEGTVPIMDRLKAETRSAHEAAEAIPFNAALVAGRLPLARYVGQLATYAMVHTELDARLAHATHPAIRAVWRDDLAKAPLLERDLAALGQHGVSVPAPAMAAAHEFAGRVRSVAADRPVDLLGYLYVLEGSTLGAAILRQHLQRALGLGDEGLHYYSPYGNAVMAHWKAFRQRMNEAPLAPAEQDSIVTSAVEAFDRIGAILRGLSDGL
ncbi:MAG: biliverdin-producing heme oxygenase [Phycisphaerales bacterium]|nr:biliverdin-producing heme oxygenase [Phycisphaerales bacterium]